MPSTGNALRPSIPLPRTPGPAPARPPASRSVEATLRSLPSHGWTTGWVGRRDRALLVLWQAGLTFPEIAALTVDDVRIEEGVAIIRGRDSTEVTLRMAQDDLLCGPCALARWLRALDLSTLHSDGRVVASVIARAVPLTAYSPHACEGRTAGQQDISGLPVFPEHDRWAPSPDTRPRPAHDVRPPAQGRSGYGAGTPARADHALAEPVPSPVDHSTALANRAHALMAGIA